MSTNLQKIIEKLVEEFRLIDGGAWFGTCPAYEQSMGFHPEQIAFEDIQPTLRYQRQDGMIHRITHTHLLHDEKLVTFQALMKKKAYYFSHIPDTMATEELPFRTLFMRWYFFRPVMYRRENLLRYFHHPLLALGMFVLYISLSAIAVAQMVMSKLKGDLS